MDQESASATSRKPSIFVGSSAESVDIAYAIQENLQRDADVTVWNQGIFSPAKYALESLLDAIEEFDFAAFVFSNDDVLNLRNKEFAVARDNVVFEMGLFVGGLSRHNCFIVMPQDLPDFRLPTDLIGLIPLTYNPTREDKNWVAALGPASNQIRKELRRHDVSNSNQQTSEPTDDNINSLHPTQEQILLLLTKVSAPHIPYISATLNDDPVRIEYYLDSLVEGEYIHDSLAIGSATTYSLLPKGRAYLVEHDLL